MSLYQFAYVHKIQVQEMHYSYAMSFKKEGDVTLQKYDSSYYDETLNSKEAFEMNTEFLI